MNVGYDVTMQVKSSAAGPWDVNVGFRPLFLVACKRSHADWRVKTVCIECQLHAPKLTASNWHPDSLSSPIWTESPLLKRWDEKREASNNNTSTNSRLKLSGFQLSLTDVLGIGPLIGHWVIGYCWQHTSRDLTVTVTNLKLTHHWSRQSQYSSLPSARIDVVMLSPTFQTFRSSKFFCEDYRCERQRWAIS